MAVYGYTRVSTDEQAKEGHSLKAQERAIGEHCDRLGLVLDKVFTDPGVSGKVPFRDRAGGAGLMSALTDGDQVIIVKTDRLSRRDRDGLEAIDDITARGARLHLLDVGSDPAGGDGRFLATLLIAMAHREADVILGRVQSGMDQCKIEGRRRGKVPWLMTVDAAGFLSGHEARARGIARIQELKVSGLSLRAIADAVSAEFGEAITHKGVSDVLRGAETNGGGDEI